MPLRPGSPARIGPNLLVTDDPHLFRHMNAPRSRWTRGTWYDGMKMDPRRNNILSERDEKKHADMRAKMIGAVRHHISCTAIPTHADTQH